MVTGSSLTHRQNVGMDYELDDDPARVQRDLVWQWLSTEAYWGRWRERADVERQLDSAWRVVGAYARDSGVQLGFARAVSDGVAFAYLADVVVAPAQQRAGIGTALVARMIDDSPGRDFRWILFTRDGHRLYERFGFEAPDDTIMVRPAGANRR